MTPFDLAALTDGVAAAGAGPAGTSDRLHCLSCPVRSAGLCRDLPVSELLRLAGGVGLVNLGPGQTLFRQGDADERVYTVLDGWLMVHKLFADGRRQIVRFALPGDIVAIEGALRGADAPPMNWTAEALTPAAACAISRRRLGALCVEAPRLALRLAAVTAEQAVAAWEQVGVLGRETALERVSRLLLDLAVRQRAAAPDGDGGLRLPLTQAVIADATGLTAVHVCRTLKRLRVEGLLAFHKGLLELRDPERLARIAQIEPGDGAALSGCACAATGTC